MSDYDRYTSGVTRGQLGAIYRAYKDGKLPQVTQAQISALYNEYDGVRHYRDGGALGWDDQVARIAEAAKLCVAGDYEGAYRALAPVLGTLEVKTDNELLEGLRKAVKAGLVTVAKTATGYAFTGATYDFKDALKSAYGARWDKAAKSWTTTATAPELAEMEAESGAAQADKRKRAKKMAKDGPATFDAQRAALLKQTTAELHGVFALALDEHRAEFERIKAVRDAVPFDVDPGEYMRRTYRLKELDAVIAALADALANAGAMAEAVSAGQLVTAQAVAYNVAAWQVSQLAGVNVTRMLGNAYAAQAVVTPMEKPKWSEAEIAEVTKRRKGYDSRAWAKLADRKKAEAFLRKGIARGLATGEHPEAVAKRLESMFDQWERRAVVIARTETCRVMTEVSQEVYKAADTAGVRCKNRWDATLDGSTRESHRKCDGEVRAVGEKFSNGSKRPGDGPAGEVINCRCCLTPVLEGFTPDAPIRRDNESGETIPYMTYAQWEKWRQKQGQTL